MSQALTSTTSSHSHRFSRAFDGVSCYRTARDTEAQKVAHFTA
jgi:hypothetical protein